MLFMEGGCIRFISGWQVLVGQAVVVNYLKSTRDSVVFMRYPGEYLFPGGVKDDCDHDLPSAALREFEEEFVIRPPQDAIIFPFNARQTRMIRGKSNMMVNFLAIAEAQKHDWLANIDINHVNVELERRYQHAAEMFRTGDWDALPYELKRTLSPEVRSLQWVNIEDLVLTMQHSISSHLRPVNAWQREQFDFHGISKRSPMSVSMATLIDIELAGADRLLFRGLTLMKASIPDESHFVEELIDRENLRFSSNVHMLARPSTLNRSRL